MSYQQLNFYAKPIEAPHPLQSAFHVYLDEALVAEVRGDNTVDLMIIPMRQLNDAEEDQFNEYLASLYSKEHE